MLRFSGSTFPCRAVYHSEAKNRGCFSPALGTSTAARRSLVQATR
jgi:hypothetical protein